MCIRDRPGTIPAAPMAKTTILPASAMQSPPKSDTAVLPLNWMPIPGTASVVAASPDGSLWVLSDQPSGPDKYIWLSLIHISTAASRALPGERISRGRSRRCSEWRRSCRARVRDRSGRAKRSSARANASSRSKDRSLPRRATCRPARTPALFSVGSRARPVQLFASAGGSWLHEPHL